MLLCESQFIEIKTVLQISLCGIQCLIKFPCEDKQLLSFN